MTRPGILRPLAFLIGAASIALASTSVALIVLTPGIDVLDDWGFVGYDAAFALIFASVGLLVANSRPTNRVGWLFLGSALLSALQTVATSYAQYARHAGLPASAEAQWFAGWIWLPAIGLIAITLILFPDGEPASPRWRAVVLACVPISLVTGLLWAVAPPAVSGEPATSPAFPPFDPAGLAPDHWLRSAALIMTFVVAASLVAGVASLRSRMLRGSPVERQQIKWVLYASSFLGPGLVLSVATAFVPTPPEIAKATQLLAVGAVLLIPVAAAIAILRYRLYDIDVLINRTLVYGALSAILGAAYVLGVVLFQSLLRPLTAGSELAIAVSTLVVAALFQPVRASVQSAVDRRFYRSRYDAARTLDAFTARLRGDVDLDSLRSDLVSVLEDTVQPAHASVWLRGSSSGGK